MNPLLTMRERGPQPDWATARLGWRHGLVTVDELEEYALAELDHATPAALPALSSLVSPTQQDDAWTVGAHLDELARLDGSSAVLAALKWRLHVAAELVSAREANDWGTDEELGPTYWRWMAWQDLWSWDEFVRPLDFDDLSFGRDEKVERATAGLRAWVERQRQFVEAADRLLRLDRDAVEAVLRRLDEVERTGRARLDRLQWRARELEEHVRLSSTRRPPA